jgi:glycosyltransferase involved in cell wall biosynthesis
MDVFEAVIRPALPEAQLWMVCEQAPEAEGVTVFSRIPLEQLTDLYRRAWVFCLPSSYEGFGVPYIEAMASGVPVVATPNPGSLEVLDNGRFGLIAEPANLGKAILELLQNSEERCRLTTVGLERVQEFTWDHIVDQYEAVYNSVMVKRGRAVAPTNS